jgi:hypothetical protein
MLLCSSSSEALERLLMVNAFSDDIYYEASFGPKGYASCCYYPSESVASSSEGCVWTLGLVFYSSPST